MLRTSAGRLPRAKVGFRPAPAQWGHPPRAALLMGAAPSARLPVCLPTLSALLGTVSVARLAARTMAPPAAALRLGAPCK